MVDNEDKKLPDWNTCFEKTSYQKLPWYYPHFDPDLFNTLARLNIVGGNFLDVGTGTGNQAIELSRRGFDVVGADVSEGALALAREVANKEEMPVTFMLDNITSTRINKNRFDYAFDRGCFHILTPEDRALYIKNMHTIIKRRGVLFLKCFSSIEQRTDGPYRFTEEEIRDTFAPHFILSSCKDTVFQGTLEPAPQAIFCVLKKQARI
jgi:cyclopropane fatty-acyl-phospholipid synthase-like methyltransferase